MASSPKAGSSSPRASTTSKSQPIMSDKFTFSPQTLYFPEPHNRSIRNVLVLTNLSTTNSCIFKLRTVVPQRYTVKPKLAFIAPKSMARVHITLNSVAEGTNPAELAKDRFELIVKTIPSKYNDSSHQLKELWEKCTDVVIDAPIPCIFNVTSIPADAELFYGNNAVVSSPTPTTPPAGATPQADPVSPQTPAPSKATGRGPPSAALGDSTTDAAAAAKQATATLASAAAGGALATTQAVVQSAKATEKSLRDDIVNLQKKEESASAALEASKQTSRAHEQQGQQLHKDQVDARSGAFKPSGGVYLSIVLFWMIVAYCTGIVAKQYTQIDLRPQFLDFVEEYVAPLMGAVGGSFTSSS